MLLLARTVRGLENFACQEIAGPVRRVRHREVWFEAGAPPELHTADDVLVVGAIVTGVGAARADLGRLRGLRPDLPPAGRGLDVSASFVGRRAYTRHDLEDAAGAALSRVYGLPYHSRRGGQAPPEGTMAWRVTVEGDEAVLAWRPGGRPAHRRPYKLASVPGTLHPPVAAAMARLVRPEGTVLDPCCGAGTTLIEAARQGPAAYVGFDLDPAAARVNDPAGWWARADAGALPLATGSVDGVLVNPPWNRQVPARGRLAERPELLWRELARVVRPGGRIVALLHEPFEERFGLRVRARHGLRLSGRLVTIYEIQSRMSRLTSAGRSRWRK
ncbi:methyltransferase domain-containing protein [Nonomuraea sp. NPDC050310]|uniref:TRM11 family SAM-dependent methyltransferase n=1 Tax=Nonomuraea sp. NPDC050310 TaxID=3154935 RepID=UPI0034073C71